jgi:hypothetical protein
MTDKVLNNEHEHNLFNCSGANGVHVHRHTAFQKRHLYFHFNFFNHHSTFHIYVSMKLSFAQLIKHYSMKAYGGVDV